MAYDTASLTYTLYSPWTPPSRGSAIVPWYDDDDESPAIDDDPQHWLSLKRETIPPYGIDDLLLCVTRPEGSKADGIILEIRVVNDDAARTPLQIRGITLRPLLARSIRVHDRFTAWVAGGGFSLFVQDTSPLIGEKVTYNFDILLADADGNLGLLDPRLVNAS